MDLSKARYDRQFAMRGAAASVALALRLLFNRARRR